MIDRRTTILHQLGGSTTEMLSALQPSFISPVHFAISAMVRGRIYPKHDSYLNTIYGFCNDWHYRTEGYY